MHAEWTEYTMVRFRRVDASVLRQEKKRPAGRQPSPEQLELIGKIKTITDESVVYEVTLESDEKPLTVRQQLLRASKAAGVEIVIRKSEKGFYVAKLTPERKSRRGRKPAARAPDGLSVPVGDDRITACPRHPGRPSSSSVVVIHGRPSGRCDSSRSDVSR